MLPSAARGQVALLAAGVALAACAGGGGESTGGGATRAEIGWLEDLARWEQATEDASAAVGESYAAVLAGEEDSDVMGERLEPIRSCSDRLRSDVGAPPTLRYSSGYDLLLRACKHYERFAVALERSFDGNAGEALSASDKAVTAAEELVLVARRSIAGQLTANRELPRRSGATGRSRTEPVFSRVATRIARKPVRVLCWSSREWPRVVEEWGAYIGETEFDAFADIDGGRVYLGPRICEGLVALAYRNERPTEGSKELEIADAVAALAHEAEHHAVPAAGEAETECYGMQDMRLAAEALGASGAYAGDLAELYWDLLYERLPDEYVSPDCRDGGPWDRNDTSSVWP